MCAERSRPQEREDGESATETSPAAVQGGNVIAGAARLLGPAIQARDVRGGIHVHAAPPAPGPPVPAPRQLLPVPAHFTERAGDLAALNALSAEGVPLIVVSGPAGIGKTTLVSWWLRDIADQFPDGQFYADLRGYSPDGPAAPGEVLGQFLRALGAAAVPADLTEQASLWRSLTADLRTAVMLDNALTAAQIRPLLPGGPEGLVVVTSRSRLTGLRIDGARFHRLEALDEATGVALLVRAIGEDRVAGELPAARRLVALCGGLPLAVCLASARLASRPRQQVGALADALAREAGRLTALEVEGETTVGKALDASYAVLSTEAALLYRRLGVLPLRTFDTRSAASACAEPLGWAERRLDELVEANLVEDIGPDTFRFHDLVRIHARDRARTDDTALARDEALRRVCEWYLRTATEAQKRLTPVQLTLPRTYRYPPAPSDASDPPGGGPVPFVEDIGALSWLDEQRMNLMAVVRAAADRRWDDTAWQLVDAMWPLFLRLRHYDLWIEAHGVGLEAARRDGDGGAERQMLNSGAIGLSAARRLDEAVEWYTQSLRAARAAGDARDEGQALLGLGACHRETGRLTEAVPYLRRAIEVWQDCGYPRGAALARIGLGEIALARGGHGEAVEYFAHARRTMLSIGESHDAARALAVLGRAHARAGEYAVGIAELEEALVTFTASGAVHWQARALEMLGECAREAGDEAAAESCLTRALTLYETTSPADAHRLRVTRDAEDAADGGPGHSLG